MARHSKTKKKLARSQNADWFIYHDVGDISLPHCFDTQVTFLENNLDYALVGSSYYQIDDIDQTVTLVGVLTTPSAIRKGLNKQNWFDHS